MGDAFSRWDGFSYYASFSEFLPSVALALILWSIVSVFTAIFVWVIFKLFERVCNSIGIEIEIEHLLLSASFFILFSVLVWKGKKLIWPEVQTTSQIKLSVLLFIIIISMALTWLYRGKAHYWSRVIHERIIPLVWLFGVCVMLAVPLVAYYSWFKSEDKAASKSIAQNISADTHRPNIMLITFDALTARHMSKYGYERETTPFIDRWSEDATIFKKVEASSNFTTPAAASLMTGKRVWTHQTYHIEGSKPLRSNVESLPAVLKDNGYFNIALIVNPFASVRVLGMSNSFDITPLTSEFGNPASLFGWKFGIADVMLYRIFGDKIRFHNWVLRNDFIFSKFLNMVSRNITQTEVPPAKAFNTFLEIMDRNQPKPFFAWIHVFPPHDPYLPPKPDVRDLNPSSELRSYKKQERLVEESYKYLFQYERYPESMQTAVNLMRDYYDEFITYIDMQFEEFIEILNKREMGNTIIILTADHGESFQHGYFTHGGPFLYEQVTHVPLIIREPDQKEGKTVDLLVEQIDIPATVLGLADIPVPSWMEGRSLIPPMRGETLASRPAYSMNFEQNRSRGHQITTGSIAVWDSDYKLIHYLGQNKSLLFNLKEDPDELNDLIAKEPATAQRLLTLIYNNLSKQANGK